MKKEDLVKGMKVKTWSGEILTFIAHNDFYAYCLDEDNQAVFMSYDKLEAVNGKTT
jgi:hypothetical protein